MARGISPLPPTMLVRGGSISMAAFRPSVKPETTSERYSLASEARTFVLKRQDHANSETPFVELNWRRFQGYQTSRKTENGVFT